MSLALFLSAALALLVAPGPTNTLMGLAGAQHGLPRVVRLLPAELFGYLATVVPLAWLGAAAFGQWPLAAFALKAMAAAWVMVLAVRLWRAGDRADTASAVTARRVCLTTLLNPKALIFGLVLLPPPGHADFPPRLALFCLLVAGVAIAWGTAGWLTQAGPGGHRRLRIVRRIASTWLAFVSLTLAAGLAGVAHAFPL